MERMNCEVLQILINFATKHSEKVAINYDDYCELNAAIILAQQYVERNKLDTNSKI